MNQLRDIFQVYTMTNLIEFENQLEEVFTKILRGLGYEDKISRGTIKKVWIRPSKAKIFGLSIAGFYFCKAFRENPNVIALKIFESMQQYEHFFSGTELKGNYVNFNINPIYLAPACIGHFVNPPKEERENQNILIEFSSPNTNKPQHLGHMRNNFIGDSMSRILTYMGNNVTKINLINDRGIHICKSMIAYQKFGEGETPESSGIKGDHLVGNYYVKYDQEINRELDEYLAGEAGLAKFEEWVQSPKGVKTLRNHKKSIDKVIGKYESEEEAIAMEKIDSPMKIFRSSFKEYFGNKLSSLGSECLEMLVQWEEDNEGVRELWRLMNSWVFDGFFTTYNDLGIEFDIIQKESEVFQEGKEIVLEALENGLLQQEDDGAIYCDLKKLNIKGVNGKKYLLRSNGTTVYMTQDIGVAYGRIINYTPDKLIYVVANEQDRHFKVLFGLLEYLNPNVVSDMTHHLSYGMVNLPSGRMKSREGTVVDADNLLKDVSISAKEITVEKWPDLSDEELEVRAQKIAMAAIKFYLLLFTPDSSITFDKDASLRFVGKTGPYILYCYARGRSVLRKCGVTVEEVETSYTPELLSYLQTEEEQNCLYNLLWVPNEIKRAAATSDTSKIADILFNLAKSFSNWYGLKKKHPVVTCEDENVKQSRLLLVCAVGNAVKLGMNLLGIETLEQM